MSGDWFSEWLSSKGQTFSEVLSLFRELFVFCFKCLSDNNVDVWGKILVFLAFIFFVIAVGYVAKESFDVIFKSKGRLWRLLNVLTFLYIASFFSDEKCSNEKFLFSIVLVFFIAATSCYFIVRLEALNGGDQDS